MTAAVQGHCPVCGGCSLFLAEGGHVTCSRLECPRPTAVDELLANRETDHVVVLQPKTFTVRHPLRERLDDELLTCDVHQRIRGLDGPPRQPGTYRVTVLPGGSWMWEEITR